MRIRGTHVKTVRYYFTPITFTETVEPSNAKCWRRCGETDSKNGYRGSGGTRRDSVVPRESILPRPGGMETRMPSHPVILFSTHALKETHTSVQKETCTRTFITAFPTKSESGLNIHQRKSESTVTPSDSIIACGDDDE